MNVRLEQRIREAQKRMTHLQIVLVELKRELDDILKGVTTEHVKTS